MTTVLVLKLIIPRRTNYNAVKSTAWAIRCQTTCLQRRSGKRRTSSTIAKELINLEQATKVTQLTIQGKPVNPWWIGIDLRTSDAQLHPMELRIGLAILLYELRQCEVHLTKAGILQFVFDDIAKHQGNALNGYLTIVRHVVCPPPIKKDLGWFSRMFSQPTVWTPPPVRWNWTKVGDVTLSDDESIAISGMCCDA